MKTRNPMGTMCGGNMYSAVHGIYAVMLAANLGEGYSCVDRSSVIKFLRPGRSALFAEFIVTETELGTIRDLVEANGKTDRQYLVELKDTDDVTCGEVTSTIHIRRKSIG